jgi:hypothetical protein
MPGFQCSNVTELDGVGYFMTYVNKSWSAATQFAHLYSYKGIVGQLPIINSSATNVLINSVAQYRDIWVGACRDEVNSSRGIFWASGRLFGQQFFQGKYPTGSVVAPFYDNFDDGQPDGAGGGLVMMFNGKWYFSGV